MSTPILYATDSPRTRATDPAESHRAADRSQRTLHPSRRSVLWLINSMGDLGGNDINDMYHSLGLQPRIHRDSPRKRAAEMVADGFLEVVENPNATRRDERIFTITEQGKRELGIA